MTKKCLFLTLGLLLTMGSTAPASDSLTKPERQRIVNHLNRTRQLLLASVSGLSESQASFKSDPRRWSIAECVEHIALVEDLLRDRVETMLGAPATPERKTELAGREESVLAFVVDRSQKFQAPDRIQPQGQWDSFAKAVDAFSEKRRKTLEFVESTKEDLRAHVLENPVGDLDAYQWLFFLSGHTERHTLQILEVRGHPDFPGE